MHIPKTRDVTEARHRCEVEFLQFCCPLYIIQLYAAVCFAFQSLALVSRLLFLHSRYPDAHLLTQPVPINLPCWIITPNSYYPPLELFLGAFPVAVVTSYTDSFNFAYLYTHPNSW